MSEALPAGPMSCASTSRQGPVATPAAARGDQRTAGSPVDANAVVSYNVRAIRRRRRWTQQHVAERLATLTGRLLPQASISAMERGADGDRRRRFDGHELYLLSLVFDVPMVYFFLPPPGEATSGALADTGQPLVDLYATAIGSDAQQLIVDQRVAELGPAGRCSVRGQAGPSASTPGVTSASSTWRAIAANAWPMWAPVPGGQRDQVG